ncbi:DUF4253 domain-containing protein [Oscillatoria salina]|uniref:DUF4253 domain-containing protein n=1 Tax=Oscillatoria salina TaxID=331517 RepID=UPI0013BE1F9C|nr:DUF4253 domain-containing protein [Oscillatoria salina]MBZ8180439.1 DUF4253 domain-containing protein [Oscillatoria salina IIICB1]NET89467.1 DUF4253 domain-containing protein [Kamptonema sp. SIO1D9]
MSQAREDNAIAREILVIIEALVSVPVTPFTLKGWAVKQEFAETSFPGRVEPDDEEEDGLQWLRLELDVMSALIPGDLDNYLNNISSEIRERVEPMDLFLQREAARETSRHLVLSLQSQLAAQGYQALVTAVSPLDYCHIFGLGFDTAIERYVGKAMVVFFKAEDASPLLWVRQTNAANYELSTVDIIRKLEGWKQKYSFSVVGAGNDWVELHFIKLPEDLKAFSEEVYEFCPDCDSPKRVVDSLSKEKLLFLWWD